MTNRIVLPMSVDRPWLWVAGLVGIVLVGVVIGLGVLPVGTERVSFAAADTDGTVEVTITRVQGDDTRRVYRGTYSVSSGDERTVWTTDRTGWYQVNLTGGNTTCTPRVSVSRRSGSLHAETFEVAAVCPAEFDATVHWTLL